MSMDFFTLSMYRLLLAEEAVAEYVEMEEEEGEEEDGEEEGEEEEEEEAGGVGRHRAFHGLASLAEFLQFYKDRY